MYSLADVNALFDRFTSELVDVAENMASANCNWDTVREQLGSRAVRLAVAEVVVGRKITKIADHLPAGSATLKTVRSAFSQARRAVKIARAADDPIIYAWLDGTSETSMWTYLRDHTVKADKLAAAFKIVEAFLTAEDEDETERFVARITLARESLSNAAEKLIASLNH